MFSQDGISSQAADTDISKNAASHPRLDEEIEAIRGRCAALLSETPGPSGNRALMAGALEELAAGLEALQDAAEALHAQNSTLVQVRADLEAERQHRRDLFESDSDACLIMDARGCVREANRQAHTLLQAGPRSLVGHYLTKFVPPADRRAFQAHLSDTLRGGLAPGRETMHEMRLIPTGCGEAPLDVMVSVCRLPGRELSGRDGAAGLCRWRLRPLPSQRELERHRALVAEVKDYAIILTDKQGQILDWNSGAAQIFGYDAEAVRGERLDLIFTPEDRAQGIPARERETAERDGRAEDDRWLVRKDGTRLWACGTVTPLYGETRQEVRWFAKVLQDRTAQKRAQEDTDTRLGRARHIADTFQQALVPETPLRSFPRLSVATHYEAAWQEARVGGDFYEAFPLSGSRVCLAVGDVSGKGLGAALRAGEIKTALRLAVREQPDPAAALARLNAFVCDLAHLDGADDHLYTTLALAILDPATGAFAVALAGADPVLILRRDGTVETCGVCGVLLGVEPGLPYQAGTATLDPGDRLVMVTDGLTEARRPGFSGASMEEAFFGMTGVTRCAQPLPRSLDDLCGAIMQGAHDFAAGPLTDDACVLAAERL